LANSYSGQMFLTRWFNLYENLLGSNRLKKEGYDLSVAMSGMNR